MATALLERTQTPHVPRRGEDVGFVTGRVRLANSLDVLGVAPPGWGSPAGRVLEIEVLFDTGASNLCLPSNVVRQLRLPERETVLVRTARGIAEAKTYGQCELTINGRSKTVNVLEVPDDARALLGVLVMEEFGISVDVLNQTYSLLPDNTVDTYLLV